MVPFLMRFGFSVIWAVQPGCARKAERAVGAAWIWTWMITWISLTLQARIDAVHRHMDALTGLAGRPKSWGERRSRRGCLEWNALRQGDRGLTTTASRPQRSRSLNSLRVDTPRSPPRSPGAIVLGALPVPAVRHPSAKTTRRWLNLLVGLFVAPAPRQVLKQF